jgi:hypothetical protein
MPSADADVPAGDAGDHVRCGASMPSATLSDGRSIPADPEPLSSRSARSLKQQPTSVPSGSCSASQAAMMVHAAVMLINAVRGAVLHLYVYLAC